MKDGRIGPYRIVEKLGSGGMGEVFKARDDRLGRWVAIKRIRPGKDGGDETRERFQREARATAQLNHPAIVHVYDIFGDNGSDCIVMEYVEGPTLQTLVQEKPLDPSRAAALGREIAEGLAEAHSKGILHRDLKTENVIVTPDGHAKILDFGLAKPLMDDGLDAGLTGKGQLVGTSRAMSPEYVGGDEVDERADLFALGVLLYEVTTCHSPFKAQNALATLKQVIVHHQRPAMERNPEVTQELSDLIDRMLEKMPADRPQTAREVAEELGQMSGQLSGTIDRMSSQFRGLPQKDVTDTLTLSSAIIDPRWRRYWAILLTLIVTGIIGAYFVGKTFRPAFDFGAEDRVVLAKLENPTGLDEQLVASLEIAFRFGLEQSRFAKILSESEVRDALRRMKRNENTPIDRKVGIEICLRETAKALIIASVVRVGDSYQLLAEVIDPQPDTQVAAAGEKVKIDGEILRAVDRLSLAIREQLGESLQAIQKSPPLEKVTTSNLEALRFYTRGLKDMERGNWEEAALDLKAAINLDEAFSMAHAKLAVVNRNQTASNSETWKHFEKALSNPDRLTEHERLYIEGWRANWRGTPQQMVHAWSLLTEHSPDVYVGHQNLGMVHWLFLNQFSEAIEHFEEVRDLNNEPWPQISGTISRCYLALDDFENAKASFSEFSEDRQVRVWEAMALYYLAVENSEEALRVVDTFNGGVLELSKLYTDQGRFEQSLTLLLDHRATNSISLTGQLQITALSARIRDNATLRAEVERSLSLAEVNFQDEALAISQLPIVDLATLGKTSVRRGNLDLADRILEMLLPWIEQNDIKLWKSYLQMLEGEILIARDQPAQAVIKIRQGLETLETFQAHDSLAFALEESGQLEEALMESQWMVKHRGRAVAECDAPMEITCPRALHNLIAWSTALARTGRLADRLGNKDLALESYRRLAKRWEGGDSSAELREAMEYIEAAGEAE